MPGWVDFGFRFYNGGMTDSHFSYAIGVRYGDLDPQGHVNNANFLTFFEQARINYLINLGFFRKELSFLDVGIIVADVHVIFKSPVFYYSNLRIELWVTRLGNKSMNMEYRLLEESLGLELACASTVLVTFDYRENKTVLIPALWRERISAFEGLSG